MEIKEPKKLLGIKKIDFTSADGKLIQGVRLYLGKHPNDNNFKGLDVIEQYVNDITLFDKINDITLQEKPQNVICYYELISTNKPLKFLRIEL